MTFLLILLCLFYAPNSDAPLLNLTDRPMEDNLILLDSLPVISSQILLNQCPGDNYAAIRIAISGGEPPYKIEWSTGVEDKHEITDLSNGQYSVTVTDDIKTKVTETFDLRYRVPYPANQINKIQASLGDTIEVYRDTNFISQWSSDSYFLPCLLCDTLELIASRDGYVVSEIITNGGCSRNDTTFIQIENLEINAYNFITPNGDDMNEYLHFDGIEDFTLKNLSIFYPSGVLITQIENYENDWNGEEEGLPDGIYYYDLQYSLEEGFPNNARGQLIINDSRRD